MLIPTGALVVLDGPSGSGTSSWATANFRTDQVVSSDALRALVGLGDDDQRAGADAFDLLGDVVERRMRRGLTTVVDSLGLDAKQRAGTRSGLGHDRCSVPEAHQGAIRPRSP